MKNTGKILGLMSVMTLLFSFSGWSQQKRVHYDKVEYVKVERSIAKAERSAVKSPEDVQLVMMLNSDVILDKLKPQRRVKRPARRTVQTNLPVR